MIKATFFYSCLITILTCSFSSEGAAKEYNRTLRPIGNQQAIARENPQLLLYYLPWCPYSQKVLDHLKQMHKTLPMKNLQQDNKGKEELRKIGGKAQVPCLIINGKAMYESATIIQWLSQNKSNLEPL
ncbi:MAG: glutathione S-transferase N-terminal domain-containing protein [Rhabdochlamydiaceae bacterium]|nr:glutathione S-transferase N-terminal domain-containing protein [Rhabdochlamydiaceae bacterium]